MPYNKNGWWDDYGQYDLIGRYIGGSYKSLRERVVAYLTKGGTVDRLNALSDLVIAGALNSGVTESDLRERLVTYLVENKRSFCTAGIQRFVTEFGLTLPVKEKTIEFVVKMKITGDDSRDPISTGYLARESVYTAVSNAARANPTFGYGNDAKFSVVSVETDGAKSA